MLCCASGDHKSASSVSKQSQVNRLVSYFQERGSFRDGKLIALSDSVKSNDAWEITSFIVKRYGVNALHDLVSINTDSIAQSADSIKYRYAREQAQLSALGFHLNLRARYNSHDSRTWFSFDSSQDSIQITEYDILIPVDYNYYRSHTDFNWQPEQLTLSVVTQEKTIPLQFAEFIKSIKSDSYQEKFFSIENTDKKAKLLIRTASVSYNGSEYTLESINGYLLLKK